ncbi:MAG: hydroxyacid dehydrogenase [Betaproteobacteria bacterium AqS2]|uniref:Hydroxyacid dehydrogenase n=1 Tax=Candidatus Amphirhobacter heronislandensis TaxID=1732024 RepID=A0A930UID7_9GAMM|nr:hydroxyacid dehydrogenase [Betaproteobacteria bacterium AqS2]
MSARPLLLLDPHPRTAAMVYGPATRRRLVRDFDVRAHLRRPASDRQVDGVIEEAAVVVGQTALGRGRLERARRLKAVINVLGNWRPNIDYACAARRGVQVLSIAPAMADAVAEWILGALIVQGRGMLAAQQDFLAGREKYGIAGNRDAVSLAGATVGIIGFGNLGRRLAELLRPFGCRLLVHDPHVPAAVLAKHGALRRPLPRLLAAASHVAVTAGATRSNEGFLDAQKLDALAPGCVVVLASRAAVVDFDALASLARRGRIKLAVDVFPHEPAPARSPWRRLRQVLWSAHRAGGIPRSYELLQEMLLEDIANVMAGRRPRRLQPATARAAADASV